MNLFAVITSIEGRKSMLKLAERMAASFCGGVTASAAHQWTTLSGSGAEDVRVMTRKSVNDPGRPPGIVLNAATSFWIPVPPKRVFDFLRDETSRSEVPCRTQNLDTSFYLWHVCIWQDKYLLITR
jgi:homeobox-leucine zipper protein